MKKIIHKVQELGQKAAQLKQAVQNVPAQAAGIREAVLATAGQLQQLRSEVTSSVVPLRADNEERLLQMLREIDGSAETLREAGFVLENVEMEMGLAQRMIVHLEKVNDV